MHRDSIDYILTINLRSMYLCIYVFLSSSSVMTQREQILREIEPNLKELFQSSDVFKFKFDNIAESVPKNCKFNKNVKTTELRFLDKLKKSNSQGSLVKIIFS